MKVSKGQSQPEIVADVRLLDSLHGSGITTILIPGFDCDCEPWGSHCNLKIRFPRVDGLDWSFGNSRPLGLKWETTKLPFAEMKMFLFSPVGFKVGIDFTGHIFPFWSEPTGRKLQATQGAKLRASDRRSRAWPRLARRKARTPRNTWWQAQPCGSLAFWVSKFGPFFLVPVWWLDFRI